MGASDPVFRLLCPEVIREIIWAVLAFDDFAIAHPGRRGSHRECGALTTHSI
jgi:hypothetical protein